MIRNNIIMREQIVENLSKSFFQSILFLGVGLLGSTTFSSSALYIVN